MRNVLVAAVLFLFGGAAVGEQMLVPDWRWGGVEGLLVAPVSEGDGGLLVSGVIPMTDARAKGILPGDVIVAIDGKRTVGVDFNMSLRWLNEGPNSVAILEIRRDDAQDDMVFRIKRMGELVDDPY